MYYTMNDHHIRLYTLEKLLEKGKHIKLSKDSQVNPNFLSYVHKLLELTFQMKYILRYNKVYIKF